MKINMKKGNPNMVKIDATQIEFDAAVADPQGVAVVQFTGARVDGDYLILYTGVDDNFRLDENTSCPLYGAHKASIADAAAFLSASDRLFEVRVNKSDVTEMRWDRLYATKFDPIREIDPSNPFEENN